jgi:hypothetical protein
MPIHGAVMVVCGSGEDVDPCATMATCETGDGIKSTCGIGG